uniref:Carboxylic ester hydrolase n=1 Tax=Acrobeloides nanus TaxID=290746 RepID=A0A914EPY9_9BILA
MIWIHGGFFKSGSAQEFPEMGAVRNLVSRGVVIVSIQYRLGVLGFLTTFTNDFIPNLGLLDQVEAIKWVKEEIVNFGGDPYRITLFGESAGSASVSAHTYSPLSQNLFQQAILESGTALTCFDGALGYDGLSYTAANVLCGYTLDMWYAGNYTALKACMMNLSIEEINNNWMSNELFNLLGWRMVQDNYFMPDVPRILWEKRPNIPIIIGTNKDEWAFLELAFIAFGIKNFTTYDKGWFECEYSALASYLNKSKEIDSLSLLEAVYVPYGLAEDDHLGWLKVSVAAFTGAAFTGHSTRDIGYYLYNNNTEVYAYQFDYPSYVGYYGTKLKGYEDVVPHGAEIPFVWMRDSDWKKAAENGQIVPTDLPVGNFFGEAWTNFAKFGRPTLDGSWQPVSSAIEQNYLSINATNIMKNMYRNIDRVIWNQAIPSQIGNWPPESPDYNNGTQPKEIPADLTCVISGIGYELSEQQQSILKNMIGVSRYSN